MSIRTTIAAFVRQARIDFACRQLAHGNASIGHNVAHIRVAPSDSEYFDAAMRAPLLRRISEETGGVFYTPQTMGTLPDDVKDANPSNPFRQC